MHIGHFQEAVTEKNLNTILNKRVLARQIPVIAQVPA